MEKIEFFDYQKVAKEMGVSNKILEKIKKEVRGEFPADRMIWELHVLRAVKSKYWQKQPSQDRAWD